MFMIYLISIKAKAKFKFLLILSPYQKYINLINKFYYNDSIYIYTF